MFGWGLGVPVGYALNRTIVLLLNQVMNVDVPVTFPPWNLAIALIGTVVLVLLVLALRRGGQLRPRDALRCV